MKIIFFLLFDWLVNSTSLTVSGNPGSLIVHQARAGSEPNSVQDSTTTYTIVVPSKKKATIYGSVNSLLPNFTTLNVKLAAPRGAISTKVALSTTPQILVSNISSGTYQNLSITYEYAASVAAGVVEMSCRTLTLTVVNN